MEQNIANEKILAVDIGGSNIKATLLNTQGALQDTSLYQKRPTPQLATPEKVTAIIIDIGKDLPGFTKIAVGFPGYVRKGHILTAPNLGTVHWQNFNFQQHLTQALGKPVRLVNDADLQGLGVVNGKGFEMVITLGTGMGTSIFLNGNLLPHLEFSQQPAHKNKNYDQFIGHMALLKHGEKKWNRRMQHVLNILKTVFNYDHLFISGGNARKLRFPLDENVTIISNREGIQGGIRLWQQDENHFSDTMYSAG